MVIALERLERATAALWELRGDKPGHHFHGNQFPGGSGGGGGGGGGASGNMSDPSPLPKGVSSTASGVRADVRKTIKDHIVPKGTKYTPVPVPGTKYTSGAIASKTGTTIRVTPLTKDRHNVVITDVKDARAVVGTLRTRGYQMADNAANPGNTRVDFTVHGPDYAP